MKNKIENYDGAADLIVPAPGGQQPRMETIFLVVDWRDETIDVETVCASFGGVPMEVYHGLRSRWEIPSLVDARYLHDFVQSEILPILDRYMPSFHAEWDGHNLVAVWYDDQPEESQYRHDSSPWTDGLNVEIEAALEKVPTHDGGLWSAWDWFENSPPYEIRADMTDEELKCLADNLRDEALSDCVILDDDLEDYLKECRENF